MGKTARGCSPRHDTGGHGSNREPDCCCEPRRARTAGGRKTRGPEQRKGRVHGAVDDPLTESWLRLMFRNTTNGSGRRGRNLFPRRSGFLRRKRAKQFGRKPARIAADLAGGFLALAKRRQELGGATDGTAGLSGNGESFRSPGGRSRTRSSGRCVSERLANCRNWPKSGNPAGPGPVKSFPRDQGFKFTRGLKAAI